MPLSLPGLDTLGWLVAAFLVGLLCGRTWRRPRAPDVPGPPPTTWPPAKPDPYAHLKRTRR